MPSTAVRRLSYDHETRTLFVVFVDGDLYAYRDVEPELYTAFMKATSKGGFFARHVRGRYPYAKLADDEDGLSAWSGDPVWQPPEGAGRSA